MAEEKKYLEFNNTRAGVIYNVDQTTIKEFEEIVQKQYDKKIIKSTIKEQIIENSEITEYNINMEFTKEKILKKIFSISYFKKINHELHCQNYLLFILEYKNYTIDESKKYNSFINNEVNEFFKKTDGLENWTRKIKTKDIIGRYIYDQKESHSDDFVRKSILASASTTFNQNENYMKTNKNSFYFSKYNLLETTNIKMDASYDMRMLTFSLALAYKNFFNEQVKFISKESLKLIDKMNAEEIKKRYTELLNYANMMAIFETAFYFKEPINDNSEQSYLLYPLLNKGLKIEDTYDEFKINLNTLLEIIKILEARIREEERQHTKELEAKAEEKEKKFTSLVGIITGIIAILTFFADGPSILENAFSFKSTPIVTWGMFIVLGIIAGGLYKWFTSKSEPTIK
ncbi:MAG: hypothetical protein U9R37_03665 [Campylobacterota bacterium]|nr:hypothetical protein [Campylobacterota bacterium]